jgi:hypothetical protein
MTGWLTDYEMEGISEKAVVTQSRHYSGVCEEILRKTTEYLSQDSRYPGRDSDPVPPEEESGTLPLLQPAQGFHVATFSSKEMLTYATSVCGTVLFLFKMSDITGRRKWWRRWQH